MWIYSFIVSFLSLHPLHVSICDVVYQEDLKALQITHRIFAEDLAKGIENSTDATFNEIWGDSASVNQHIHRYLDTNFQVYIRNKEVRLDFLGSELEDDIFWCYLEATGVRPFDKMDIRSSILTEVYDDQENIVHIKISETTKSLRLNKGNPKDQVEF